MADLFVNQELSAYLIAQGVAVDKNAAITGGLQALPSVWLLPRAGAPEPRDDGNGTVLEQATITLSMQNFPPPDQGGDLEEAFIDVLVRARTEPVALLLHRQIRGLLIDVNHPRGMKFQWTMGALLVEYSTTWRVEQSIGANDVCYDRVASYRFGCRRKVLAGLPFP
jgi:hypothetical protein